VFITYLKNLPFDGAQSPSFLFCSSHLHRIVSLLFFVSVSISVFWIGGLVQRVNSSSTKKVKKEDWVRIE
jgi:hypothetical protein